MIFRFGAMEKEQSENNSLQNTCNLALMKILEQQYKEGFHMNSGEDRTVMMMSISESENYREITQKMVEIYGLTSGKYSVSSGNLCRKPSGNVDRIVRVLSQRCISVSG